MESIIGQTHETYKFDYLEFIKWCEKTNAKLNCKSISSNKQFTGTDSWNEALDLAHGGWNEGVSKIKNVIDKIEILGTETKFEAVYDVTGDTVDIGRYLSNVPENMIQWELTENKTHKVVNMYFNAGAGWDRTTDELINYGAVGLSVLDYLESSGTRVNLFVYVSTKQNGIDCNGNKIDKNSKKRKSCDLIVQIKHESESLNLPICAFAICHPSFLRRFYFRWLENQPHLWSSSYGSISRMAANYSTDIMFNGVDFVFNCDFKTEAGTEKWLNECLAKYKIDY